MSGFAFFSSNFTEMNFNLWLLKGNNILAVPSSLKIKSYNMRGDISNCFHTSQQIDLHSIQN